MRDYIKLLRVKHYIKNLLVFAALIFSGQMNDLNKVKSCAIGFVSFCLISSSVYIINDIRDRKNDAIHPQKKKRPIASGRITVKSSLIIVFICMLLSFICLISVFSIRSMMFIILYLVLNIAYSFGLKNYPLVDVSILVSGFIIRVIFGACITQIEVSGWLYLTIISISFFLAFGKRRNELRIHGTNETRKVLQEYNIAFLDKSMYLFLAMSNTFYALWAVSNEKKMLITFPFFLLITLKYSLNIEKETSDGDPTEVLFHDKVLILMCLIYALLMFILLYFNIELLF